MRSQPTSRACRARPIAAARVNLIDTLACTIAGSTAPGAREVVGLVKRWGGAPDATILGFGGKVPAHHAAWANGTMAHARDYDDTHDIAVLHAGVSDGAGRARRCRIDGIRGQRRRHARRGRRRPRCRPPGSASRAASASPRAASSIPHCSAISARRSPPAASSGSTHAQMINAIGIAYSQVAGNHQVTRDAALTKRMQPGFAAKAAIVSAELAQRGIRGVTGTFDGVDGFFRVYLRNEVDRHVLLDRPGTRIRGHQLSYKPYPCCRHDHAPIDAALEARRRWKPKPDDIRRVEVRRQQSGLRGRVHAGRAAQGPQLRSSRRNSRSPTPSPPRWSTAASGSDISPRTASSAETSWR